MMESNTAEHRSSVGAAGTSTGTRRLVGAVTTGSCAVVLALAVWMTPSASGVGTHEQLNLPSCGWITIADMPCMTCGMTTAFSHAARGEFLASFLTQPLGFLLAMGTAMGLVIGMHTTLTGANVVGMLGGLWRPRTLWMLVALGLGAWVFKIVSYKGILT